MESNLPSMLDPTEQYPLLAAGGAVVL